MQVAHATVITPGRCGLYETTHDLVKNLRKLGVDSRLVDPDPSNNPIKFEGTEDRGVPVSSIEWALNADILVSHSGLGNTLNKTGKPVVHIAHGRPKSSFIGEQQGKTPIYSYTYNESKKPDAKAVVTFWPEHIPYLEVMWHPVPIYCVTSPVDLDKWNSNGPNGYKFNGNKGKVNIVCTDAWRDDIDPFPAVNAFALYNRKYPGAKLHIYGALKNQKGWGALLKKIKDENGLGEVLPWIKGLENVYRAADLLITPHKIAVRSIREALACGCPVHQVDENKLDPEKIRSALNQSRENARKAAEINHNPENTAKEFIEVLNGVIR